ncbi:lipocalin family protein [Litorivivens sp.]|uniref:lipocalin family protein n=1 Tax=Litorivivens sp. TaxID=2020868 RepID=UPI0035632300
MRKLLTASLSILLSGCLGMPETVTPVKNFELERYLGQWYEIARLDHSFERGLEAVTAEYSLQENGSVKVLNRGYSSEKGKWKEAIGKAYPVDDEATGYLKVSFFGPFYASYAIFVLDHKDYEYALVSGPDTSYLWLLARQPTLDEKTLNHLVEEAAQRGFDTSQLIFVDQSRNLP